jgi:hypothetical protein
VVDAELLDVLRSVVGEDTVALLVMLVGADCAKVNTDNDASATIETDNIFILFISFFCFCFLLIHIILHIS